MKFLIVTIKLLLAAALISGAALNVDSSPENVISETNGNRTGKALLDTFKLPYDKILMNLVSSQLGTSKPWRFDQPSLEKVKHFVSTHKEVIFSGVAGALVLIAILLIVSHFTGLDSALKSFGSGLNAIKNRVDDFGLKPDAEHINTLTNRVFQAIESWKTKNLDQENFEEYEDDTE